MRKFASLSLAALALFAASCGQQERTPPKAETEVDRLRKQIADLTGTVSQINGLVLSDWASCVQGGSDGLSAFQRNICRIAQAATAEQALKWRGVLADFASSTERELKDLQNYVDTLPSSADVTKLKSDLWGAGTSCGTATAGSVCARLTTAESNITSLQSTVGTHTTQISTLISDVATINSQISAVINGAMLEITVGQENLAAGPLYEAVLRNPGRSRLTAYIESLDANITVPNNGCSATNGSPNVVITATNSFAVGNVVKLSGFTSCRGITAADMNDSVVVTAATATTFTFVASSNATSTGSGGGSSAYVQRVNGRGLGMAWQTSDAEQLLTTTFSNKPYKFLMTGPATVFTVNPGGTLPSGWGTPASPGVGFLCYSIGNRSATAANIKAGGSDVRCY